MTQQFSSVAKDRLFYDRFKYSITFALAEVSALRELDHDRIDALIVRRNLWREQRSSSLMPMITGRNWRKITQPTIQDLHELATLLLTATAEFKLVVSVDTGWVYTNSLDLIDQLDAVKSLQEKSYARAVIDRPKGTIKLKNSVHGFRSYFKTDKMTVEQKKRLAQFLFNHTDQVRISPSLAQWIDNKFLRAQDYFFIDYNSEQWLTMLSLVQPGLIRKTLQIIPAK